MGLSLNTEYKTITRMTDLKGASVCELEKEGETVKDIFAELSMAFENIESEIEDTGGIDEETYLHAVFAVRAGKELLENVEA